MVSVHVLNGPQINLLAPRHAAKCVGRLPEPIFDATALRPDEQAARAT